MSSFERLLGPLWVVLWWDMTALQIWLRVLPKQKAGDASEEEAGREGRDGTTREGKPIKKDQLV